MIYSLKSNCVSANFLSPLDLTSYISKVDYQYVAGGGYGDVYKCWYRDGSPKEVRVWSMTHATCHLPLSQGAVKAFRFRSAINGDSNDRSAKVTQLVHNQNV